MPDPTASPARSSARRVPWFGLALLACAVLGLIGGISGQRGWGLAALAGLLAAWFPRLWVRHESTPLALWLALAVLLLVPAATGHAQLAWMALPVVFPAAVASLFGRSLRRGREPLVARFIRVLEGDAQLALPGVRVYARGVTVFWTCVLAALAGLSLALALLASPGGWLDALGITLPMRLPGRLLAWYPEAGCWLLLAAAFAAEYGFRRWWLRGVAQLNPLRFIARLAQRWPELMRDERGAP